MSHIDDQQHHVCTCGCGGGALKEAATQLMHKWQQAGPEELVCPCRGVQKQQILHAIEQGAFTVPLLKTITGAGRDTRCRDLHPEKRSCEADLQALLDLYAQPPDGYLPSGCGH